MNEWADKLRYGIGSGTELLLSLLFPPRCPICDRVLSDRRSAVCRTCRKKLPYVIEPYCMKCGKALDQEGLEYCPDCSASPHAFLRCRSLFVYDGDMKKAMYRLKYAGRKEYARTFARMTEERLGDWICSLKPDVVVCVPLHKNRLKKRGYNQAGLFARALSERLGLFYRDDLALRVKNTLPQKNLSRSERQKNLKKAFKIRQNDVKLNTVLLVDDIYTTGSTLDSLAQAFLQAGALRVYCVTICTGKVRGKEVCK